MIDPYSDCSSDATGSDPRRRKRRSADGGSGDDAQPVKKTSPGNSGHQQLQSPRPAAPVSVVSPRHSSSRPVVSPSVDKERDGSSWAVNWVEDHSRSPLDDDQDVSVDDSSSDYSQQDRYCMDKCPVSFSTVGRESCQSPPVSGRRKSLLGDSFALLNGPIDAVNDPQSKEMTAKQRLKTAIAGQTTSRPVPVEVVTQKSGVTQRLTRSDAKQPQDFKKKPTCWMDFDHRRANNQHGVVDFESDECGRQEAKWG